jgi:DNA processing protein
MHDAEILARISWGLIAQPGDPHAWALIDRYGPEEALAVVRQLPASQLCSTLRDLDPVEAPSQAHLARWQLPDLDSRADVSLTHHRRLGLWVLSPQDSRWPQGLCDLGPYQPHSLWIAGEWPPPKPLLAVVGSRAASPWGRRAAGHIVNYAVSAGYGIVSGGAVGIDQAAHLAALELHADQMAVLAGGLDVLYPTENRGLFARMRLQGVLVAEVPCTVPSEARRFLSRNRLIAALSDAVVVVEAAVRSGAMNTASHAAALGRGLGVVPGRWEDGASAGCFRIVRERGALVLTEPQDVEMLFLSGRSAAL